MLTSMDLEDLLNGLDENDNEMWSMLATLHETQDDTTPLQDTTPNSSIIDTLRDRFFYEPQDFTERLVTIIEQSVMEDAIANNSRFNSSFMKLINEACCADIPLIQDESLPISFANTESEGYSCSNSINLGRRVRLASPMCSSPDIMKIKFNKRQKKGINPATPVDTSRLAIPRVHLTPGTPIDSSPNQLTIEHDEEYLTAESETDESNDFETDNEGAKFNDNLNMSMVKYCHAQWLQSFALYEPKVSRRKSSANNSELAEFRDNLMRKRTKCFQVVKSLIDQNGRIALTSEMNKDCHSRQRLSTDGFCTTIEACNEYRRFITNNDDTLKKNKKTDSRFVSSATIKVTMKQSPRLCTKKRRTSVRSSVRKSPVTSKSRVVSPRSTSPLVDQTRIRPVAQLRTIFSPTRRVYPPREYIQWYIFIQGVV